MADLLARICDLVILLLFLTELLVFPYAFLSRVPIY